LFDDYDSFITSIISHIDSYIVEHIETMLLAQQARFEKHRFSYQKILQANLTSRPRNSNNQLRNDNWYKANKNIGG